uniref:Uncharacterized protein n=1 Tax=Tanacetum cinerariifolium TaxID=118510 RepID=A0A699IXW6_TANCI|nr:hypothetical protein [Tanacetum cinerariifolium]
MLLALDNAGGTTNPWSAADFADCEEEDAEVTQPRLRLRNTLDNLENGMEVDHEDNSATVRAAFQIAYHSFCELSFDFL